MTKVFIGNRTNGQSDKRTNTKIEFLMVDIKGNNKIIIYNIIIIIIILYIIINK